MTAAIGVLAALLIAALAGHNFGRYPCSRLPAMNGIWLALAASGLWGTSDFYLGLAGRRTSILVVTVFSQLSGFVALSVAIVLHGRINAHAAFWGFVVGVIGVAGLMTFFHAMRVGSMSIVAPIVSTSSMIPVLSGVVRGDRPSILAVGGMVLAMVGIMLASRTPNSAPHEAAATHRRSVVIAVAAAALLGSQMALLGVQARVDPPSGVWAARIGSLVVVGPVLLIRRPTMDQKTVMRVGVFGVVDAAANLCFVLSTGYGMLSLVAVLSSLYPVVTVGLAFARLHERLTRSQTVGVVAAILGVALIAGSWSGS